MATIKQVAGRAWEMRSGVLDHLVVLAVGALAAWAFTLPWWTLGVFYLIVVPGLDVLVAWISLRNDAAEQEQATDATGEDG